MKEALIFKVYEALAEANDHRWAEYQLMSEAAVEVILSEVIDIAVQATMVVLFGEKS